MFDFGGIESLVSGQGVETTGSGNDDMGALCFVPKQLYVLRDGGSAVEGVDANIGHVLREASVFVFDLEGKLTSVTKHEHGDLAVDRLQLLERSQHKDSRLSVTRFGLA